MVVPNLSNLHLVPPPPPLPPLAAGVASGAASTAVVVASVEADVVSAVGEEADTETEEDLETEAAVDSEEEVVASGEAGMTLDHREVEVASGVEVVAWASKAEEGSTTARLLAGTEVLLDLVVGLVDQVGMVLLEGQVTDPPAVVVLVGMAETEDTSNERAREVTTTGTQNDHGTRFFAIAPQQGMCKWVV